MFKLCIFSFSVQMHFWPLKLDFLFQIYHLGLNTLIGLIIPMGTLLYLNICICCAIRKKRATNQFQTVRNCKILRTNSVKNREKTKEMEKASTRLKVLEQEDVICEIDDDEEVVSNTKDSENER